LASKKKKQNPNVKTYVFRFTIKLIGWLSLFSFLFGSGYAIFLDRTITSTFEGRRWSVPAQIYAQPLELYQGTSQSKDALSNALKSLGYRPVEKIQGPGTFRSISSGLEIYLRGFSFIDDYRGAQKIQVAFSKGKIQSIRSDNKKVPLIRLEPATIGSFFPSHGEDRIILSPEDVPNLLSEGLKSIEDREFDLHQGISLKGILRAFLANVQSGEIRQGGSTLTQQLVKSYYLTNRQTLERKIKEVAMSLILEARFSKTDLLTAYINEIFLGQNGARAIHGFGLGSHYYFNKPIHELNISEIATLISIIRGPSYYNPFRYPERAFERRNRILNTFHNDGLITEQELAQSLNRPLGVNIGTSGIASYYPAFLDQVRQELSDTYNKKDLSSKGLRIFTTLRTDSQEILQASVSDTLSKIETQRKLSKDSLEGAAIIADNQTGEILAMVGGRNAKIDGFNRALNAIRPIGSLIKPVIFLTAIESDRHLASLIDDSPITITPRFGEPWSPKNFDDKYRGEIPLFRALSQSLNLATVQLGEKIGLEKVLRRYSELINKKPKNTFPSFYLGAEELSPISVLELYNNFASGGFQTPPKAVIAAVDSANQILDQRPFNIRKSIDYQHVTAINGALEIVMTHGTGRNSPYSKLGVAGKTGTSNDNRDSWFAGFDNKHSWVIWVGRDDNQITGLTGSSGALRVWNRLISKQGIDPIQQSNDNYLVEVEFSTGLVAKSSCANTVRVPITQKTTLPVKPGCGIKQRRYRSRYRD